jgi:hypothetical protein
MYRNNVMINQETGKTQFNKIELHFKFKKQNDDEPFVDPTKRHDANAAYPFEPPTDKCRQAHGQLIAYATEWCTRQHRLFAFSVFINASKTNPYVCFIRWDRSGAVISAPFSLYDEGQLLVDFLWRFSYLSDRQRGLDETVRFATKAEIAVAHEKLTKWKNVYDRPVLVFTVQDGDKYGEFLAWGSTSDAESLTGRCTRVYPVYEITKGLNKDTWGFLKDTWRAETLEKESNILRTLNNNGVPSVPQFICGGDIDGHVTRTDLYAYAFNASKSTNPETPKSDVDVSWVVAICFKYVLHRYHHRFVEDFIGYHLEEFTSSKHMMQAVFDAYIGVFFNSLQQCFWHLLTMFLLSSPVCLGKMWHSSL